MRVIYLKYTCLQEKYKVAVRALQAISQRDSDWSPVALDCSKAAENALKIIGEPLRMDNKEEGNKDG